jgi:hypothetical protein
VVLQDEVGEGAGGGTKNFWPWERRS